MTAFSGALGVTANLQILSGTTWTTISDADILEFSFMRGRTTQFGPLEVGKLLVALNNSAGTYSGYTSGQAVRLRYEIATIQYVQFYGELRTNDLVPGIVPTARLEVWDAVWGLSQAIVDPKFVNTFGATTSGDRVAALYTAYPQNLTGYGDGGNTGTVAMLPSFGNITALQAFQQCASVEAGPFFIAKDGSLFTSSLLDKFARPQSLYFADDGSVDSIPYTTCTISPGSSYLVNTVTVERPSRVSVHATSIKAAYDPSVTAYGTKEQHWSAPVKNDASAEALAAYVARLTASSDSAITFIEFAAIDFLRNASTLTYATLADLELRDYVSITRDGGTWYSCVEGIQHLAVGGRWTVRLYLSPWDDFCCDIANGLATTTTTGTFVYATPGDWTIGTPTDTVRAVNSLDVKWEDFADRGAASGGTSSPLDLYANAKQVVVYDSNSTGAYQFNIRGGSSTNLNAVLAEDQCVTFSVLIKCNNAAHYSHNTVKVDGTTTGVTTIWLGGAPTAGTVGGWDAFTITCYVVNATTPTYRVVVSHAGSS